MGTDEMWESRAIESALRPDEICTNWNEIRNFSHYLKHILGSIGEWNWVGRRFSS
jgi:hypothetical protein